jgi:hypothetical protein
MKEKKEIQREREKEIKKERERKKERNEEKERNTERERERKKKKLGMIFVLAVVKMPMLVSGNALWTDNRY